MNLRLMTRRLLLLLATLALGACTQSYTVFSDKYFVSFSCDMSAVPFNSLHTLGHFLAVRPKTTKDGYRVKSPDGTERDYPYTEVQSRVFSFGLAGLIIGQPYFEEGIYALTSAVPSVTGALRASPSTSRVWPPAHAVRASTTSTMAACPSRAPPSPSTATALPAMAIP